MTDAPERIWVLETDFGERHWQEESFEPATQYIRADLLDAHIGAVLEEAAGEADQIAAFPRPALWNYGTAPTAFDLREWKGRQEAAQDIAVQIRALRPDAMQALERVRREARVEGMRAAFAELRSLHKSMAHFLRVETWEGYKEGVTDAEETIRALIAAEERGEVE